MLCCDQLNCIVQGTQTPVQSPQNIISDLIARKRGQLLRRARGRDGVVEAPSFSVSGPAPAPALATLHVEPSTVSEEELRQEVSRSLQQLRNQEEEEKEKRDGDKVAEFRKISMRKCLRERQPSSSDSSED